MKFKVVGGSHNHYGVDYAKGDVVETDLDLLEKFPNKFERVFPADVASALSPPSEPDPPKDKTDGRAKKAKNPKKDKRGVDVTSSFPLAVEECFLVFKRGAFFHIYEEDDFTPMNEKGLREKRVEKVIKKLSEE